MGVQINQLSTSSPSSGQSVPAYDPAKGDTRRWPLSDLLTWIQANLVFPAAGRPEPNTQYAAPSATGFSVDADAGTAGNEDVHIILTPAAAYAAGTINLPAATSCRDKQIVIVNCTQQVTALTIGANGAAGIYGAPSALGADDFFTLKYDATMHSWYRIG